MEALSNETAGLFDEEVLAERPMLFSGKRWIKTLRENYGENLRGLSLAELECLPDTGWVQPPPKVSLLRKLGFGAIRHPGQPGFRFRDCPDFFDGKSYVKSLVATYGEDLETLPPAAIGRLPKLERPDPYDFDVSCGYLTYHSPARRTDLIRAGYEFLEQLPVRIITK